MKGRVAFMEEAVRLARRGLQRVSPNPLVGAVIVRGDRIVGRGWHRRFGGAHAEIEAIRDCKEHGGGSRGADLYVSLEPCGHHGKTPPCAVAIVKAGLRRVFYAVKDPNPQTCGRGPTLLRRHGVDVHRGLLEDAATELNAAYFHWRQEGTPWVILKWAMSADGKICSRTGDARWVTSEAARRYAHAIRRRVDAILVGTGTYLRDDPLLLPRPSRGRTPLRVVLDRRGRLPLGLQVFRSQDGPRLYVTSAKTSKRRLKRLEGLGVETVRLPVDRGRVRLRALLGLLGERGVSQLLVEGGETLHGAFWDAQLVHEVVVFVAPKIVGGKGTSGPVGGRGIQRLSEAWIFDPAHVRKIGPDILLEGRVGPQREPI